MVPLEAGGLGRHWVLTPSLSPSQSSQCGGKSMKTLRKRIVIPFSEFQEKADVQRQKVDPW